MTVKLLCDWKDSRNGREYKAGNLLTTDAGTESGLISIKNATSDLSNATAFVSGFNDFEIGLGIDSMVTACPSDKTAAAIIAAMNAIATMAKSGCGIVKYEDADYIIDQDITLLGNIRHFGVAPKITMTGDVPDANFSCSGGTRFILSAGVTGLKHNNVAKGAEETNITDFALSGVRVENIAFIGGKRAIDTGAYHSMGLVYGEVVNCWAFDQTDDYAFNFVNFQHMKFDRLYSSSQIDYGGGIRFGAAMASTLLTGNSEFGTEIYSYCKNIKNRSVVFEAFGPSGCVLNQLKVSGRLQGNRYGAATPTSITMAFTNGSTSISIVDNGQFDLCQLDMPVAFNTAVAGFSAQTVYFVASRGANTITLTESLGAVSAVSATATTSGTGLVSGYPSIEIIGRPGNIITNSDFGLWDAEAYGNVCAVSISRTRNVVGYMSECMTSYTSTALATRDASIGITYAGLVFTQDQSALHGFTKCTNIANGPYPYSGGSFTLDSSWAGRDVRYTGTTDITITVPNTLPKGFTFSITPTGATGIITFAPSAGGAIFSYGNKLRTAGQYATARLDNIANRVFRLTGDLQV